MTDVELRFKLEAFIIELNKEGSFNIVMFAHEEGKDTFSVVGNGCARCTLDILNKLYIPKHRHDEMDKIVIQ